MPGQKSERRVGRLAAWVGLIGLVGLASAGAQTAPPARQGPPPDGTWITDALVDNAAPATDPALGAAQGVVVRDGRIYAYGDLWSARPRVGVIREYDLDLNPTGREVRLTRGADPLIVHPTGLTWHDEFGTFLGDTVLGKARIYQLDWNRAWTDGNLDRAVLAEIDDDAAINGCRPLFVTLQCRTLLATADYGSIHPELRLCDPGVLLARGRTSAPGAVVHRVLCGPFNQNLHFDHAHGRLTCVQNVIEGRGWRLDTIDLERAVADGRTDGPGVRIHRRTFPPHDELEGYWPLDDRRVLFVTSSRAANLLRGVIRPVPPRPSPPPANR